MVSRNKSTHVSKLMFPRDRDECLSFRKENCSAEAQCPLSTLAGSQRSWVPCTTGLDIMHTYIFIHTTQWG